MSAQFDDNDHLRLEMDDANTVALHGTGSFPIRRSARALVRQAKEQASATSGPMTSATPL